MFLTDRARLLAGLLFIRNEICAYRGPKGNTPASVHPCDCKYGVAVEGKRHGELTGCPEILAAHALLGALTEEEFDTSRDSKGEALPRK